MPLRRIRRMFRRHAIRSERNSPKYFSEKLEELIPDILRYKADHLRSLGGADREAAKRAEKRRRLIARRVRKLARGNHKRELAAFLKAHKLSPNWLLWKASSHPTT